MIEQCILFAVWNLHNNWTKKLNNRLCEIKNDGEIEFILLPYRYDLAQCIKIKMYKT